MLNASLRLRVLLAQVALLDEKPKNETDRRNHREHDPHVAQTPRKRIFCRSPLRWIGDICDKLYAGSGFAS